MRWRIIGHHDIILRPLTLRDPRNAMFTSKQHDHINPQIYSKACLLLVSRPHIGNHLQEYPKTQSRTVQHVSDTNHTDLEHIHRAVSVGRHSSIVSLRHSNVAITASISISSNDTLALLKRLPHVSNSRNHIRVRLRLSRLQISSTIFCQLDFLHHPACCQGKARPLSRRRRALLQYRANHGSGHDTHELRPYQEERRARRKPK